MKALGEPEFTVRAVVAGLTIGTLICISNCYFGLQTGWISMMSLPASLLGFGMFKIFEGKLNPAFSRVENVLVQTIAVASGTMPLAAGLVGVVPALEKLLTAKEGGPLNLSTGHLLLWSAGVAFFGVFFTIPLRKQVLIKERLKFPSGTATAEMITVLHKKPSTERASMGQAKDELPYHTKIKFLAWSFIAASTITVLMFFFPNVRNLAVFDWITLYQFSLSSTWLINFQPSLAYMGQGIIMGLNTTVSMLLGAIIGWCILSPISKAKGWAPGPVGDYNDGARGWIVWVSLAIMLSDSIVSLLVVTVRWVYEKYLYPKLSSLPAISRHASENGLPQSRMKEDDDAPPSSLVPMKYTLLGIFVSSIFCIVSIKVVFPLVPIYLSLISIVLALFLSILGVRALGETDLNPVSGIGKISQLLFALLVPKGTQGSVIINLVAGGVAEAGAQQAGDLMQDLKTGHLLGASPRVQTYGQLIGSLWSVVVSVLVYRMYTTLYTIPGDIFAIPTAYQWVDCARLVDGTGLPPHVHVPALSLGVIFGCTSLLKAVTANYGGGGSSSSKSSTRRSVARDGAADDDDNHDTTAQGVEPEEVWWRAWIPSGLAVAVGMYNTPNFTLARLVGGVGGFLWLRHCERHGRGESRVLGVIVASGFILGEGVLGSLVMLVASLLQRQ